jgi:hypothetical protein
LVAGVGAAAVVITAAGVVPVGRLGRSDRDEMACLAVGRTSRPLDPERRTGGGGGGASPLATDSGADDSPIR